MQYTMLIVKHTSFQNLHAKAIDTQTCNSNVRIQNLTRDFFHAIQKQTMQ